MLLPRLLRSLRPCHRQRQRSSAQIIRRATSDAHRKLPASTSALGPDHRGHHHADGQMSGTNSASMAHRPSLPSGRNSQPAEKPVCVTCNRSFNSKRDMRKHCLFDDACAVKYQPLGYLCTRCYLPFPLREQAQAHARERRNCAARIHSVDDPKLPSALRPEIAPLWMRRVREIAEAKHRKGIRSLVLHATSLSNKKSPHSRLVLDKMNEYLHHIRIDATKEKDIKVLEILRETDKKPDQSPFEAEAEISSSGDESLKEQIHLLSEQVKLLSEKFEAITSTTGATPPQLSDPNRAPAQSTSVSSTALSRADANDALPEGRKDHQRLARQIHTEARLMRSPQRSQKFDPAEGISSAHVDPAPTSDTISSVLNPPVEPEEAAPSSGIDEHSLLKELFPEAYTWAEPYHSPRNPYPKLNLPNETPLIRRTELNGSKTDRDRFVESFQSRTEQLTALQLLHSSTELTESDFRRIIPKGKHIESWASEGEFVKVIPGRDPISLERLPFYYIVFRSPEAALAYQNNATRLHKLCQLHQPTSILSAVPPPKGVLEDGEDIGLAVASYLLKPAGTPLNLNMLMKPYNPILRNLIEQGGYTPIIRPLSPPANTQKSPPFKVLLKIEGHEPLPSDIYKILRTDAYSRGLTWPFHNGQKGIQRLRDVVDLKAKLQTVSADNPRAWNPSSSPDNANNQNNKASTYPGFDFFPNLSDVDYRIGSTHHNTAEGVGTSATEHQQQQQINQVLMNRVYNRWLIEFEDEQAARRFARVWNMRPFPITTSPAHWVGEGDKTCETEFLW